MMKRNDGFTLVELLVTIVIGTIITAAASLLLITGLRINTRSNELAIQQNTTRMLMEVMAEIAAEEAYGITEGNPWELTGTGTPATIVSFENNTIYLRETALLENVKKSTAYKDKENDKLVDITIEMEDGMSYSMTVYCRFLGEPAPAEASSIGTAYAEYDYQEVMTFALESQDNSPEVTEFLTVLASQYGSRGQILDAAGQGTGEYFSEWYIGGYEANPGWDAATPWCACYLSWAADRCEGLWQAPRYANVDTWWADVVTGKTWSPSDPNPGDIVFFDWIVDETPNPQHVGAVLAVYDGWIYTIEGNSGNRVTLCRYEAEDPCILGYGKLDWK